MIELVVAIVGSALIGFGLSQALGSLGWQTAIGLGLLLVGVVYIGLAERIQSRFTKYGLILGGVILVLLPSLQA